jgi:hypothetical protein
VPIVELLSILMEGIVGKNFVIKYPEFSQLVISLPLTLVYVVVFLVLFWVLKLLLLPLNAIINRIIFNRRPKTEQLGFSAFNNDEDTDGPLPFVEKLSDTENTSKQSAEADDNNEKENKKEKTTQQVAQPKTKKQLKNKLRRQSLLIV